MSRTPRIESTELIQKFKKANKQAREKIALKHGFKSAQEYLNSLTAGTKSVQKKSTPIKKVAKSTKSKIDTIKNVIIVDNSGSMSGAKILAAVQGVKEELESYRKSNSDKSVVKMLHTIVSFSANHTIHVAEQPINEITYVPNWKGTYSTALYSTIVKILGDLFANLKDNERALVKIFTDGEDTDSTELQKSQAASLINLAPSHRVTVTFVGTEADVKVNIANLNLEASNTLVHDNTGAGVRAAFKMSNQATAVYVSNVAAGASEETLTKGFYYKTKGKL